MNNDFEPCFLISPNKSDLQVISLWQKLDAVVTKGAQQTGRWIKSLTL